MCYGVGVMVCVLWCGCYGMGAMVWVLWCGCYGVGVMVLETAFCKHRLWLVLEDVLHFVSTLGGTARSVVRSVWFVVCLMYTFIRAQVYLLPFASVMRVWKVVHYGIIPHMYM